MELQYGFDFMIEGPRLTMEELAVIEDNLCNIWTQNSSELFARHFVLFTSL